MMQTFQHDIVTIASRVCRSVLGDFATNPMKPRPAERFAVSASVPIVGSWAGAIILAATQSFADHAAARMFGLPLSLCGEADAERAVIQLAQLIADHLQAYLPANGESRQLLPKILQGDSKSSPDDLRSIGQAGIDFGGSEIAVSVLAANQKRRVA